jgi:pimeloyl-ACP methyl ester carboxylesterase
MASSPTIVLVPGFWLGGWAWDDVATHLRAEGFDVTAVTLPVIDSLAEPPIVVAHSGGGLALSGVLDAAPGSVARAVYVDSGPWGDDTPYDASVPADAGEVPLPSWDEFAAAGASLEGLDDQRLATFRARAVPQPARVMREPLRLTNDARRSVPSTIIACSIPSEAMFDLAGQGAPMFAEVTKLTDLEVVDLPTGHWPMWSRPADLAVAIAAAASR